jgi:D-alanyl-D-alanine carboxypeptidase
MGFRPGIQVTVDNALKMMMVKSANDMAVVLAEGVGGSVDGFSAMMNQTAAKLGMTQTSYVNPNGLPADGPGDVGADLAILARAVIRDLPEYEYFMHIPSIRYGRRITQNFNKLIGRYPRRRRLQDRLHLRFRLQPGRVSDAQRQAADRRRARRILRAGARGARGAIAGARLRRQ